LQTIQGYAEVLGQDDDLRPDTYRTYAREIGGHCGSLLGLLNAMLDVSRLDNGGAGSDTASFDLTLMVSDVCQQAAEAASSTGLSLEWHMPNMRILFQGDEGALRRAFVTIIHKAILASPAGSRVMVRLTVERGGEPCLTVTDAGLGLNDDEVRALQEPLQDRPDDGSLNEDHLGSVSLALVRGLVDLHGGAIAVTTNPGSGTMVQVVLPRHRVLGRNSGATTLTPTPDMTSGGQSPKASD